MMQDNELKHGELTGAILHCFYKRVYARLGYGFSEKVYENALVHELRQRGMKVVQQQKINVYYDGVLVGEYFADIVVSDKVILELKAVSQLLPQHKAQLLNYLRATNYEVGLLLNFGPEPKHIRRAFDNTNKMQTWKS